MSGFYAALAIVAVVLQALRTYWAWRDHRSGGQTVGTTPRNRRYRCPCGSHHGRDLTSGDAGN